MTYSLIINSHPGPTQAQFTRVANLLGEVLVLKGHFAIPKLSAISHLTQATYLTRKRQLPEALAEAEAAAAIDGESITAQMACGSVMKMPATNIRGSNALSGCSRNRAAATPLRKLRLPPLSGQ